MVLMHMRRRMMRRRPMMRRRRMRRRRVMRRRGGLTTNSAFGTPYRTPTTLTPSRRRMSRRMDSLAIFKNPFARSSITPKIPDGKTDFSAGIRFQNIAEHVMDPEGVMTFILYPGFGAGVRVLGTLASYSQGGIAPNGFPNAFGGGGVVFQPLTSQGSWNIGSQNNPTATVPQNNAYRSDATLQQTLNQWRLVSQGLRLSLTNNAQENDGWWESIRLTVPTDTEYWGYSPAGGANAVDYTNCRIVPRYDVGTHNQDAGFSIVDHPTYKSGKLRDIHKCTFKLNSRNGDHNFTEINDNFTLDLGDGNYNFSVPNRVNGGPAIVPQELGQVTPLRFDAAVSSTISVGPPVTTTNTYASGLVALADGPSALQFKNMNLDMNFDLVIVRIHGRPASTVSVNSTPTRILSHLVSNQEIIYPEGTIPARLMSANRGMPIVSQTSLATASSQASAFVSFWLS